MFILVILFVLLMFILLLRAVICQKQTSVEGDGRLLP